MSKSFNQQLGLRIRTRRDFLGITREELCNHIDLSPQFLSEIERGVKGVSAETLLKLCSGLGLSADYILTGKQESVDISEIVSLIQTIDEKYIPSVEELLKAFFKAIALK